VAEYLTGQDEVLDAIVWAQYGRADVIVAVLEANPGLADLGPVLPTRTRIVLPDLPAPAVRPVIRLWGAG
jgi:phage tail protein X